MTDDLETTTLEDEKNYLETEMTNIQTSIATSMDTFQSCTTNITTIFEDKFLVFQTTIKACMAV